MKRLIKPIFWVAVFLTLLLCLDQALLRLHVNAPAIKAVQVFYLDFRSRLIGEQARPTPQSIEAVIEQHKAETPSKRALVPDGPPVTSADKTAQPRFLYVDDQGDLHFANSLEEVPGRFKASAEPLGK